MQYTTTYSSPLGEMVLSGDGEHLTGLWFLGQKYFGSTLEPGRQEGEIPVFQQAKRWLDLYFQGLVPDFMPPLAPKGSPFRREVWDVLARIPRGTVMTYGEIGALLAKRRGTAAMSAQAVGGAVGHNPISILIPCHRVVGSSGSLTGYAGGLDRKVRLLELEGADIAHLHLPKKGTAL